jgi:putative colanic acid biosynthesis acetyltransferase WcaF
MSSTSARVDVSHYQNKLSLVNRIGRSVWGTVWLVLFRTSPVPFHHWRAVLLRIFGAKLGRNVHVYPTAKVWAPWNLEMDDYSCLGQNVDCYCVAPIKIAKHATVSQYSYLCTASHDIEDPQMPLVTAPITIGEGAWITADVFIAPGVTIGDGAVVGARSSVFKDVDPWTVVAGNPAKFIKVRELKHHKSYE